MPTWAGRPQRPPVSPLTVSEILRAGVRRRARRGEKAAAESAWDSEGGAAGKGERRPKDGSAPSGRANLVLVLTHSVLIGAMKRDVGAELEVEITAPTTLEFQIAVAPHPNTEVSESLSFVLGR